MSLEKNLQRERVVHLDLNQFAAVETGTSVKTTIERMRAGRHHCAIVMDNGQLIGIFTDRDILRKVVTLPETWERPVDEVMTATPITVNSNDAADKALALMDEKHFRNVPVLDANGAITGNLTHYAIIKYLADNFPESVYNLPPDPDHITRRRSGA